MKVSDHLREAGSKRQAIERDAFEGVAQIIGTRLDLIEKYVKQARRYLEAGNKAQLKASLKAIGAAGKSTIPAVDKL